MEPIAQLRQSKKTVTLILVITAVLAIASVITGYFYFQIKDVSPKDSNASNGCGCYFVIPTANVTSCSNANSKMAYEFRAGQVQSGNICSASCDLNTSAPLVDTKTTPLSCKVDNFPINPGCVDLSIEDEDENRYANSVPSSSTLNLKASFTTPTNSPTPNEDYYSKFSFLINGEKTDVEVAQAATSGEGVEKEYLISTQLKDYSSADSLTIQAIGTSTTGSDLTSDACHRVLTVSKSQASSCTVLNAEIINETDGTPKVNEIRINTSAISSPSTLSLKFTIGSPSQTLTTKNIASLLTNNALVLDKTFLYKASNFVDGESFSILDKSSGTISISSQMYVNGETVTSQSCSGTFDIPVFVAQDPRDTTDNTNTDNTDTQTDTDSGSETADTTTSDFSVRKTASLSCVERVSPSNTLKYTITVTNEDTNTESIVRVEDKLPLGFAYKSGTTYINGASVEDDGLVTITTVGSSQQITFDPNEDWSLEADETLTIRFSASVSATALSGSNLNEVVVVPVNNPKNSSSVRTSASVTVAQSCTAPETGLFDSTLSKVILSLFIIFLGTFLYFSQSGIFLSEKLLSSGPMQSFRFWKLRNDNPKKYFEEKFLREIDREKKN